MKDKEFNPYSEDRPFNMAILFLTRLDQRLNEKDLYSIRGDVYGWYRILRTIYRNCIFKFDEDERKNFNDSFKKIKDSLKQQNINNRSLAQQTTALTISNAEGFLDDLDLLLSEKLYDAELVFPKKLNISFEEEIENDF